VQAKEELQAHMEVKMVINIHKFEATLVVKGWSFVRNHPLFNTMLVASASEQFLRSVDTTGYQKTVQY
jgi:hypothetical protein